MVFVLGIQMLLSLDVSDHLDCVLMSLTSLMHMYDSIFSHEYVSLVVVVLFSLSKHKKKPSNMKKLDD